MIKDCLAAALVVLLSAGGVQAQTLGGRSEVYAGSEFESYLRYLQTLGKSPPSVWSLRGLSPVELDAIAPSDSLHPWAKRYSFSRGASKGLEWDFVRPTVGITINSAYPFGSNDGPIWAGKGLTSWAQTGMAAWWGVFSAKLAPIAFRAENQEFPLMPNGQVGNLAFADGQFPAEIDRPQRFGNDPYTRIDFGESFARVDVAGIGAGISTESQWWGPTVEYPYILGNNAGGFPHVFAGTSHPANIGFGHAHGRLVYGLLKQSPYSPVTGGDYFKNYLSPGKVRFMAGLTGVLQIRGIPGFEVGAARFFHSALDSGGIQSSDITLPLQNLLKSRLRNEGDTVFGDDRSLLQNQLASIFFRWAPPRVGFELYGEYGREDFSSDVRDFLLEPDHSSTVNVGFRKAWMRQGGSVMDAFRAEFFTYEVPAGTRTRGEGLIYLHQPLRQGHTFRGQMLGANTGAGSGSAYMLAYERFAPSGRLKGFFSRVTQKEVTARGEQYTSGPPVLNPVDAQVSIGAELTRFIGSFDITGRLVLTSEMNRYFESDKSNANLGVIFRQGF
ncbi:MAG: capsule assembly Wzi family protein [Gemmatimonadales bacterium]